MSAVRSCKPTSPEITNLCTFIEKCLLTSCYAGLEALLQGTVRAVLPHEMVAFGILEMGARRVVICRNVDFPEDYIRAVVKSNNQFASPLFDRWVRSQAPQVLHADNLTGDEPSMWTEAEISPHYFYLRQQVVACSYCRAGHA